MSYRDEPPKHQQLVRVIEQYERKLAHAKSDYARRQVMPELLRMRKELEQFERSRG